MSRTNRNTNNRTQRIISREPVVDIETGRTTIFCAEEHTKTKGKRCKKVHHIEKNGIVPRVWLCHHHDPNYIPNRVLKQRTETSNDSSDSESDDETSDSISEFDPENTAAPNADDEPIEYDDDDDESEEHAESSSSSNSDESSSDAEDAIEEIEEEPPKEAPRQPSKSITRFALDSDSEDEEVPLIKPSRKRKRVEPETQNKSRKVLDLTRDDVPTHSIRDIERINQLLIDGTSARTRGFRSASPTY